MTALLSIAKSFGRKGLKWVAERPKLAAALGAVLLVAGVGVYLQSLRAENRALESRVQQQVQTELALRDSLRVVATYQDSLGTLREVARRTDFVEPDSLAAAEDELEERTGASEDVEEAVVVRFEADTTSVQGRTFPTDVTSQHFRYVITGTADEYGLDARLQVRREDGQLRYALSIDPPPRELRLYRVLRRAPNGFPVYETVVDAPGRVRFLESYGAAPTPPSDETAAGRSWTLFGGVRAVYLGEPVAFVEAGVRLSFGPMEITPQVGYDVEHRRLAPGLSAHLSW